MHMRREEMVTVIPYSDQLPDEEMMQLYLLLPEEERFQFETICNLLFLLHARRLIIISFVINPDK